MHESHKMKSNRTRKNENAGKRTAPAGTPSDKLALDNERTKAALDWENEVTAVLAELSRRLLASAPIQEISLLILDNAKRLTGSPFGFVGYIDSETGYFIEVTLTSDIWEQCQVENKKIVFKEMHGLRGWVLKNGAVLLTNAPDQDSRSVNPPHGHIPIHRFLGVPAVVEGKTIGEIALANAESDYTERDLAAVEQLAILYAIAVQRLRNEEKLQKAKEELEIRVAERTKELQKIKDSLTEAQRIVHLGNWDWDIVNNQLAWSDEIYRIFGVPQQEFKASYETFLDSVHPDDRAVVNKAVQEALQEKKPYNIDHRIVLPDGSFRIVQEQAEVTYDQNGKPSRMVGTVQDITDRKRAEAEVQKLFMAIEQASDWVVITDKEGNIEYANRIVEEITGYKPEELIGKKTSMFKSGKYSQEFYKKMWDIILSGKTFRRIMTNRKKNGELFDVFHTITPLKDEKGNITHFIATSKDLTQQKQLEEKLNYLAFYDSLTDLPNRTLFLDRIKQSLRKAGYTKRNVALLLLNIDRFKMINDTFGSGFADNVLQEIAKRISTTLREGDTVARLGSDEFGIALIDVAAAEDVIRVVEKIMNRITQPIKIDGQELGLTVSIGISLYPTDGKDEQILIRNASIALTKAKQLGRKNYQFYTSELNVKAAELMAIESYLVPALKNDEFRMYYQPYFDITSKKLVGFEALIRWKNEALGGMVSPAKFIPILEETGMITEVGAWIFHTVCRQVADWIGKGYPVVPVAVNLSAVQFRQKELAETLIEIQQNYGFEKKYIIFEVTESTVMADVKFTQTVLNKLKEVGFAVAIDDFGTGYSSLSYLKKFPLNILKIDISFIREVATDPDSTSLVTTIIGMAHSLGLKTIAEGVETEEQGKILRLLRCDIAQGYYYSKPLPAEEVIRFLAE
ncbi:MAG: EAL domain-containing protein [bacterium]|nr:EAL domain-containing protein [bacterium]